MVRRAAATLAVIAAFSSSGSSQSARAPQIESISSAQMRADLFFLSSDAMQGRLTDTRENAIAAELGPVAIRDGWDSSPAARTAASITATTS